MIKKTILCCLALSFVIFYAVPAAAADELLQRALKMFQTIPLTPPVLDDNPATPEKILLGKMLFFDPRLSKSAIISCNTCHNVGMGGADFQETSIGHGWQKGSRNAPTVLNAVFNIAQFWDGRAADLKEQAKGPVQAAVEMNNDPAMVIKTLKSMPGYIELFHQAFPGEKAPLTFDNMAKAIEVFEATLITPDAPFDKYLNGDEQALTRQEKAGLQLFMDKNCAGCHGGKNLGGTGYFPFGVIEKPASSITADDPGRFKLTGVEADQNVFKSPSLRNIDLTPPYFHSGRVWSLKKAVALMGSAQMGITLSEAEQESIIAFLKSATGTQPRIEYPVLPAPTAETPRPVN